MKVGTYYFPVTKLSPMQLHADSIWLAPQFTHFTGTFIIYYV